MPGMLNAHKPVSPCRQSNETSQCISIIFRTAMPFLFSVLTLRVVAEYSYEVINEIRRKCKIP